MTANVVDRREALRAAVWRLAFVAIRLRGALTLAHPAMTPTERAEELRQAWAEVEELLQDLGGTTEDHNTPRKDLL